MMNSKSSPLRYVWLSIGVSIATIALKTLSWHTTGSVSLLSDALESVINLVAALIALVALTIALRPADKDHPFGHHKAEYFSSVFEGMLIVVAAVSIAYTASLRLMHPRPIESLGVGIILSVAATLLNWGTATVLFRAAKKHHSITLEADAHHLMTDVYTTGGVIGGLILVKITHWYWLDPVVALAVALQIVVTGYKLITRSVGGLMDQAIPKSELDQIEAIIQQHITHEVQYHALYTRRASSRSFITFHLLIPGDWSITKGHELTKTLEKEILVLMPRADVFIHLEPVCDPESFEDYL